jgi:RNA polymerase sigma factor (sigma-70 family)
MRLTLTDTEIIEAARSGDIGAIDELLRRYHPVITRFARRYCATPADVEDAVQETLWIATQKIGTLRVAAAFGSWAFQVVRRSCYRLLNGRRREAELSDTTCFPASDADDDTLLHLRQDIAAALMALPPEQRDVILMCDIEEFTASETAARLSITVPAVKARLHRARKMLRQSLAHWRE